LNEAHAALLSAGMRLGLFLTQRLVLMLYRAQKRTWTSLNAPDELSAPSLSGRESNAIWK